MKWYLIASLGGILGLSFLPLILLFRILTTEPLLLLEENVPLLIIEIILMFLILPAMPLTIKRLINE